MFKECQRDSTHMRQRVSERFDPYTAENRTDLSHREYPYLDILYDRRQNPDRNVSPPATDDYHGKPAGEWKRDIALGRDVLHTPK